MSERRISVELELEIARYLKSGGDALAITRTVKAQIEDLGDEADDTSRDMDQLALNTDAAASRVDELGDEARGTAVDLALLEGRLNSTARAATALAVASALPDGGTGGSSGRGVPFPFPKLDFSNMVAEARGVLMAQVVLFVAAASPVIGGMIAAAVTGAVGLGGIAGGIAAAAHDSHVRQAASEFGQSISSQFFGSGSAFVGPIIASLDILEEGFRDLDLESTFATVAPHVTVIAQGLADMGREFMPGFQRALVAAGPAIQLLAQKLPEVGKALGGMFGEMAESKGMMLGLAGLLNTIGNLFNWFGSAVAYLGDRLVAMNSYLIVATGVLEDIPGPLQAVFAAANDELEAFAASANVGAPAVNRFGGAIGGLAPPARDATQELESLLGVVDRLIPDAFDLEEAQDAAADAIARLAEQVKQQREDMVDGAGALTGNTQAARDNRDMVRGLVEMYAGLMVKAAEAGESTDALKDSLKDQLIQMGFNETEVQRYIDQLDRIPAEKITKLTVENQLALQVIQETERELNRMMRDRQANLTIATYREGERASSYVPPVPISPASAQSYEGRRASGGPVRAYGAYTFQELGQPEVLQMGSMGGFVFPSVGAWQDTMGGGTSAPEVHVYIGDQELRGMVRVEIRETNRNTKRRVQAG